MSKIAEGYKQTEVGVIPNDWEVVCLGEMTIKVGSGITPTGGERVYKKDGRPFLRSQNVGWGHLLMEDIAFIDDTIHDTFKDTEILENDVFLNITGASIGRSAVADSRVKGGNVNQHVCIIRTVKDKLYPRFLNYLLLSRAGQKQIDSFQAGGNRQGLNFGQIRSFKIPLPPTKAEQTAIATALSDADALISSLEKLIAKKRNIKQGAMQQLLTGKKRLPGFSGKWEVKKLGNLGKFRGGSGFPTKYQGRVEGNYPFFKVSDMNNEGNATFMINSNNWISETVRKETSANTFPRHSIVFAKIGAAIFLERKKVLSRESCIDNNMMGFILDEGCAHFKFIYYLFLNIQLGKLVSTTALPSLNGREIAELEFGIPEFEEQTAIVQILSDMDAEIEALEKKMEKYKMIKQGMMQELLTGKTRLV